MPKSHGCHLLYVITHEGHERKEISLCLAAIVDHHLRIDCHFALENFTMILRYHGRWIDSVWKSRSNAGDLKENPINLYIF